MLALLLFWHSRRGGNANATKRLPVSYYLIITLSHYLIFNLSFAQTTYPIQVNTHLLPPYSLYLSDYYSGTRERLTVTLINRDQLKPLLNVRLKIVITAQGGVRLETNPNTFIKPIQVESGAPVRLTLDDLAPYLQPSNLITQGYLTAGKLPEGYVQFCVQAYEAFTNQPLSLSSCAQAWITSQKPPLLSLPANNENVVFREPLNIMFQWTPRHQGLTYVEYEFILKELWDNGMTPQAAFQYSPEIYRETVRSTSLIYGAFQPPLIPGKRYAWAVRAQAREGVEEVNQFQNDGYSEVRTFVVQDNCAPPEFVMATAERKRINVEWSPFPEHIGFTVSYREIIPGSSSAPTSTWANLETQQPRAILYGLKNGATYEYRVASFCMTGQPVYSPIFSLTLPQEDSARLAQCGIMPDINLTNREPIKELKTGDVIKASDYPVTITRVSGGNGVFTGEGWTIIPWLNDAKLAVQFTNITVNTNKQMIAGYIDAKYDRNEGQIADLDDIWEGGFDVGTVKTGITKIDYKFDFSIPGVDAFSLNDQGELVITDNQGTPHTINQKYLDNSGNEGNKVVVFPMTVEDKDGRVYQVEKIEEKDLYSNVTSTRVVATEVAKVGQPLSPDSFDPKQLDGTKAIVRFSKGDGYYGFDEWKPYYGYVSLIKDKYEKLFLDYYAPWKFMAAGKTDIVYANIEIKDNTIDPKKVIFKTPKGTEFKILEYNEADKKYKLQLAAGPGGDVQEIYALHPREGGKYWNLGKLSVASYQPQTFNVVLVSVNNAAIDNGIEQKLKEIYGPAGITWQVVRDAFDYTGNIKLMENSTGISTYNEAMRALNNQYKQSRASTFDSKANYLFFLKATGAEKINDRDAIGFMPRGSQFGYIFTSEVKDVHEPITVAHELGHGRFKLFHTFDKHYGAVDGSTKTENLMDYNNGGGLAKWQWDQVHDPAWVVGFFESDAAGAMLNSIVDPEIIKYAIERAKALSQQTSGVIYGLVYCKKCNEPKEALSGQILYEGVEEVSNKLEKCLVVFYDSQTLTENFTTKISDGLAFAVNGNYNGNGEAFFGITNRDSRPLDQYVSCTSKLDQALSTWNYCIQEPSQTQIDLLFKSLDLCIFEKNLNTVISNLDGKFQTTVEPSGKLTVKINRDYLRSLQAKNPKLFEPSIWDQLEKAIQDLIDKAEFSLCEPGASNCVHQQLNFLQVINLNIQSLAENNTIDKAMWSDEGVRNILPTYAKWNAPGGGVVDGLVDEGAGIVLLVKTIGELSLDPLKQEQIVKIFTKDGIKKLGESLWTDLLQTINDPTKRSYTVTKAGVTVVFLFYSLTSEAGKQLDNVLAKADDLAGKIENAPSLRRQLTDITKAKDIARINRLSKLIDEFGAEKLERILAKVDVNQTENLLQDLATSPAFWDAVKKSEGLVEAWKILDDAGRTVLKVDPDVLTKLNKVLQNTKLDDFLPINTATRNITNRRELVNQIVKLQYEAGSIVGKRMSGMGDLMDELDHFLVKFSYKPGAREFIKEISESGDKMAGGSFVLKTLKNNADELGTVVKFESTIASAADDIGDIVVDVITDKGVIKNVFNEFKNWQSIPTYRYSSFSKQFTGYLTNKNLGEFSYFFKKGIDGNGFNSLSELRAQVISALSSTSGRAELSKLDIAKIKSITDNPFVDDLHKVDALIEYLDEIDNFEQVFKLID